MGNQPSTTSSSSRSRRNRSAPETATERAKKVIGDLNEELKKSVKKLDEDHPAAQLIDNMCGGYFDDDKYNSRSASYYSEDASEDGSRTISEDDTYDDRSRSKTDTKSVESASYVSQSDYDSDSRRRKPRKTSNSFDTEEESKRTADDPLTLLSKPLASSFAKRCYFTKSGIGKTTQHYEGLTLTGNVVLMLAAAMKLKGCPTICDEDLRRVEQTYPNQFSRLPDELLLSSGWRRISKYCHFSNKPTPDGVPFFHSKQRLHPSGGYYFLLAASVGMVRPLDVEPLTKDTLVLLETDFPSQCDSTPNALIRDADQWTLVNKFCFFSGGPINTEEDVYYQADFDGNPIFMLAFLSPSLTPEELYKLGENGTEPGLKSVAAVQEVESVYDLTERDFDDLKLYHLGPCRALPQYILQPSAWTKVLPPHFLAARQHALLRAQDWGQRHGPIDAPQPIMVPPQGAEPAPEINDYALEEESYFENSSQANASSPAEYIREIEEEGAFHDESVPIDEAIANRFPLSPPGKMNGIDEPIFHDPPTPKLDPPDHTPPSMMKRSIEEAASYNQEDGQPQYYDDDDGQQQYYENDDGQQQYYENDDGQQQYYDNGGQQLPYEDVPDPEDPIVSPEGEPSVSASAFFPEGEFGDQYYEGEPPQEFQPPPEEPFEDYPSPQNDQFAQEEYDRPPDHYPMSPLDDDFVEEDFGVEEKKIGFDEPDPVIEFQMTQESDMENGEDDFTPIKRDGFSLGTPRSIVSHTSVESHQSAALRAAQELLKKNRRRRVEMAMKQSKSREEDTQPDDSFEEEEPDPAGSPRDEDSAATWESGSELTASVISGSSVWTDGSGNDRSSRRALILQMAKARMKSSKDSPDRSKVSAPPIDEEDEEAFIEEGFIGDELVDETDNFTEANTDIDFSADLD
jgi:hypothetical protein